MEEVTADDIRLALVPLSKKVGRIIRYGKYADQVCVSIRQSAVS